VHKLIACSPEARSGYSVRSAVRYGRHGSARLKIRLCTGDRSLTCANHILDVTAVNQRSLFGEGDVTLQLENWSSKSECCEKEQQQQGDWRDHGGSLMCDVMLWF
jgi:hypothetical protein